MGTPKNDFLPLYRHSLAISDLGQAIASYFSPETNFTKLHKASGLRTEIAFLLLNDALLIPKTINKVAKSNSKAYRIKQLLFINAMIKNLLSYCNGLEKDGVNEREYLQLFRKEVWSFRKSFKTWRMSF